MVHRILRIVLQYKRFNSLDSNRDNGRECLEQPESIFILSATYARRQPRKMLAIRGLCRARPACTRLVQGSGAMSSVCACEAIESSMMPSRPSLPLSKSTSMSLPPSVSAYSVGPRAYVPPGQFRLSISFGGAEPCVRYAFSAAPYLLIVHALAFAVLDVLKPLRVRRHPVRRDDMRRFVVMSRDCLTQCPMCVHGAKSAC